MAMLVNEAREGDLVLWVRDFVNGLRERGASFLVLRSNTEGTYDMVEQGMTLLSHRAPWFTRNWFDSESSDSEIYDCTVQISLSSEDITAYMAHDLVLDYNEGEAQKLFRVDLDRRLDRLLTCPVLDPYGAVRLTDIKPVPTSASFSL